MNTKRIASHEFVRKRWSNDRGWTREILACPAEGQWLWRLSIAELQAESEFSQFADCDREMVLLSGAGVSLNFREAGSVELSPTSRRHRFSADSALSGSSMDAQVSEVLNLIWNRQKFSVQSLHRPLAGSMLFVPDAGATWLIYVLAGQAHLNSPLHAMSLSVGDCGVIEFTAEDREQRPLILEGGGELLLSKLIPN